MNILITGGTSFIGAYVVEELLANGHHLTVLARDTGRIDGFVGRDRLTLLKGSLGDTGIIRQALDGMDAVVYLAHIAGTGAVEKASADLIPALQTIESAIAAGVKQFIFTSSTAAIGELTPVMSEERNLIPNAWWGACKGSIENFIFAASFESSMRCCIVRPSLTFGRPAISGAPTEGYGIYRDVVGKIKHGKDIVFKPGDGTQMTFAGDVARVYSAILSSDANRRIYHAVCQERTSWREFAARAIAITGSSGKFIEDASQPAAFDCAYGAENIERDFGLRFSPWPALEEHIRHILATG